MLPRASFFAWKLMHLKTPTHDWAQSIGISLAPMCCLCNNNLEKDLHLLFYCIFATFLWIWILQVAGVGTVTPISPSEIWQVLSLNCDKLARKGASSIFFTTIFVIWKCRNVLTLRKSKASHMKVKIYLTELLCSSLRRLDKSFSGRPL